MARAELSQQLAESSARLARSGLAALPSGDHTTFALSAGIALEHALKAVLAKRHPALIAAADFDSLLHACGDSADARIPRRRMKTITPTESLKRVGQLMPSIQILSGQLAPLFDARNGVAHLGDTDATDEFMLPFVKAAEHLRDELGVARGDYWGEYEDLIIAALEAEVADARLRVETALAAAREEFERRYGKLDEKARAAIQGAIEAGYTPEKYEEDIATCPACHGSALVAGATETHWEMESDVDASFIATFVPGYLRCRVCDLELDGEDELRLAGVEQAWEIDADPADFYEPDYY